jgi:Zn-dependent protease
MRWSAKLGRFAGIDVFVHVTFLALLAWFAALFWQRTGSLAGVATGLGFVLALFFCVLLHEYGHALTARRFGIATRHITLLPIGGVAVLAGVPRDPRREIAIALAGPAVNLAIAAAVWLALRGREIGLPDDGDVTRMGFMSSLLAANLALALFNLLPAFPMDGGRVLRAALALRMGRLAATRIAAAVGRALAVGLGVAGLLGNPLLVLIAVFVWIGAGAEARAVAAEESARAAAAARRDA